MTDILNGEVTLQPTVEDSAELSLSVSEGDIENTIRIDGEASLNFSSEGDCSLYSQIDGVNGSVYVVESGEHEKYSGPYEVTPKAESQTLKTKSKLMGDDVTIKSIPTYEVSNESGGTTFYIADIGG